MQSNRKKMVKGNVTDYTVRKNTQNIPFCLTNITILKVIWFV